MSWNSIKKIEKRYISRMYWQPKKEGFSVVLLDNSPKKYRIFSNLLGPIAFTDDMFFANELLHKVEEYAEQYGIPIVEPNKQLKP